VHPIELTTNEEPGDAADEGSASDGACAARGAAAVAMQHCAACGADKRADDGQERTTRSASRRDSGAVGLSAERERSGGQQQSRNQQAGAHDERHVSCTMIATAGMGRVTRWHGAYLLHPQGV
jgi:hypothetical protein